MHAMYNNSFNIAAHGYGITKAKRLHAFEQLYLVIMNNVSIAAHHHSSNFTAKIPC